MSTIAIKIIKGYQFFSKNIFNYNTLPFLFYSGCRQYPTCSEYTVDAITEYGFAKGILKGLFRILRCNPMVEQTMNNEQ